jgi:hypothetical protein
MIECNIDPRHITYQLDKLRVLEVGSLSNKHSISNDRWHQCHIAIFRGKNRLSQEIFLLFKDHLGKVLCIFKTAFSPQAAMAFLVLWQGLAISGLIYKKYSSSWSSKAIYSSVPYLFVNF